VSNAILSISIFVSASSTIRRVCLCISILSYGYGSSTLGFYATEAKWSPVFFWNTCAKALITSRHTTFLEEIEILPIFLIFTKRHKSYTICHSGLDWACLSLPRAWHGVLDTGKSSVSKIMVPCLHRDGVWIPAGVCPVLDTGQEWRPLLWLMSLCIY
jgi:hypothetical protein